MEVKLINKVFEEKRSFKTQIELNKKVKKIHLLRESKYRLTIALQEIERAIAINKELCNRTELWENEQTFNYQINNWNDVKKVRGYLTRYYNIICRIARQEEWLYSEDIRRIERKENEKNKNEKITTNS